MDLWTEYEGVTIDSAYALTQLLQPEGRSAFFSTTNRKGESVLIRIIECHFDEDEILARWRGVEALGHPNFLRIESFGNFRSQGDNATAVYAVFERVDANLGEVLKRGCLSAADATDIGLCVCSALETLHANGFAHEHIEVRNIYAVSDTVKLRSDCIREAPEGEDGVAARRRDVHELAVVLMQVLLGPAGGSATQRPPLLPAPFDAIVRNGMNGSWGLGEIGAALRRGDLLEEALESATIPEPASSKAATPGLQTTSATSRANPRESSAMRLPGGKSARPEPQAGPRQGRSAFRESDSAIDGSAPEASARQTGLPGQKRASMELPVIFGISERDYRRWTTVGALALGLILMGWILLPHWFGHSAGDRTQQVSAHSAAASSPVAPAPAAGTSLAAPARGAGSESAAQFSGVEPMFAWRVVAFTYNRQDQAQKKASSLAREHPSLQPAIFSPTGRAPWLVTVGGALQRDAAYALARRAHSLGLPRDTYAQNYSARSLHYDGSLRR